MRKLNDGEKLVLIEKQVERKRKQSDGENTKSVKAEARGICGLSRATAYNLIVKGESLKTLEMRIRFEKVFSELVMAEPGSVNDRRFWESIQETVKNGSDFEKHTLLSSAVGTWADAALDETKSDAERILMGRACEFVSHKRHHGKPLGIPLDIKPQRAFDRGSKVMEEVVKLLLRNETPPAGMFDHGSPEARRLGYNVFRTRMIADQLGWQMPADDKGRTELLERAYHDGVASTLMQIDDDLGHIDISYSYRAFVLATHAGDWPRAAEYALTVLKFFPAILTQRVSGIKAMLDDNEVFPGLAAMIALRRADLPVGIRNVVENPDARHQNAMRLVNAMTDGIKKTQTYLTVLATEQPK
jgi:hypothetical protein